MTPEETFDKMLQVPGDNLELVIQRSMEAQGRDGLDASFSRDVMEGLEAQMRFWIGSRIIRFSDERGIMPQTMTITLNVELEA